MTHGKAKLSVILQLSLAVIGRVALADSRPLIAIYEDRGSQGQTEWLLPALGLKKQDSCPDGYSACNDEFLAIVRSADELIGGQDAVTRPNIVFVFSSVARYEKKQFPSPLLVDVAAGWPEDGETPPLFSSPTVAFLMTPEPIRDLGTDSIDQRPLEAFHSYFATPGADLPPADFIRALKKIRFGPTMAWDRIFTQATIFGIGGDESQQPGTSRRVLEWFFAGLGKYLGATDASQALAKLLDVDPSRDKDRLAAITQGWSRALTGDGNNLATVAFPPRPAPGGLPGHGGDDLPKLTADDDLLISSSITALFEEDASHFPRLASFSPAQKRETAGLLLDLLARQPHPKLHEDIGAAFEPYLAELGEVQTALEQAAQIRLSDPVTFARTRADAFRRRDRIAKEFAQAAMGGEKSPEAEPVQHADSGSLVRWLRFICADSDRFWSLSIPLGDVLETSRDPIVIREITDLFHGPPGEVRDWTFHLLPEMAPDDAGVKAEILSAITGSNPGDAISALLASYSFPDSPARNEIAKALLGKIHDGGIQDLEFVSWAAKSTNFADPTSVSDYLDAVGSEKETFALQTLLKGSAQIPQAAMTSDRIDTLVGALETLGFPAPAAGYQPPEVVADTDQGDRCESLSTVVNSFVGLTLAQSQVGRLKAMVDNAGGGILCPNTAATINALSLTAQQN